MIMKKTVAFLVAAGIALASVAAFAQMQRPGHSQQMAQGMPGGMMHGPMMQQHMGGGMGGGMHGGPGGHAGVQPRGDAGPSSLAFQGINAKMHEAMSIAYTGNADVDFVKGMIPHHQGAVDMAKTVLAFGKDPEIRKLAEEIVKAQETEIALMNEWLKKTGR
jgi:uncharacterized protein (DUF305 family)